MLTFFGTQTLINSVIQNDLRHTRRMPIIATLKYHLLEGLILFDTGAAEDVEPCRSGMWC